MRRPYNQSISVDTQFVVIKLFLEFMIFLNWVMLYLCQFRCWKSTIKFEVRISLFREFAIVRFDVL